MSAIREHFLRLVDEYGAETSSQAGTLLVEASPSSSSSSSHK